MRVNNINSLDAYFFMLQPWRMNLGEWLSKNDTTQAAFAARIGVTQSTISKLVNKALKPDLDTLLAIERETGDEVRASDFVQDAAE